MADHKDRIRRFYEEVFEAADVDAADRYVAEDAVDHDSPPPGVEVSPGREGMKAVIGAYLEAFSSMRVDVHEQYQDGDTVISRLTFSGTHSGTFAGVPATGRQLTVEAIDIVRFDGDLIAEHWGQQDSAAMLAQLGLLPAPA